MSTTRSPDHGSLASQISPHVRSLSLALHVFLLIHCWATAWQPEQAFHVLRRFLSDSRHHFVADDLSCEDRVLRTDLMSGANQITDHYLVALARQHRMSLATLDQPVALVFADEPGLVVLIH